MIAAALILAGLVLNLVRGGAFGASSLPGHPRYLAAAAFAVVALLVLAPVQAGAFGLAFLAWSWLPWGRWYDLGRMADDYVDAIRPANWFERQINRLPNDADRLIVRNLIGLVPGALLLGPVIAWLLFAPAQVAVYEAAWRVYPKAPIRSPTLPWAPCGAACCGSSPVLRVAILLTAALLSACARLDVNGYRAKGGSTGAIHCKGSCP